MPHLLLDYPKECFFLQGLSCSCVFPAHHHQNYQLVLKLNGNLQRARQALKAHTQFTTTRICKTCHAMKWIHLEPGFWLWLFERIRKHTYQILVFWLGGVFMLQWWEENITLQTLFTPPSKQMASVQQS